MSESQPVNVDIIEDRVDGVPARRLFIDGNHVPLPPGASVSMHLIGYDDDIELHITVPMRRLRVGTARELADQTSDSHVIPIMNAAP